MRKLLLIIFICVAQFSMFSQDIVVGLTAGATFSWFDNTDNDNMLLLGQEADYVDLEDERTYYFDLGVFVEIPWKKHFTIHTGVNYTRYGQDYTYNLSGYNDGGGIGPNPPQEDTNVTIRQDIIEIPILVKLSLWEQSSPYIVLGPSVQLLICDIEVEEDYPSGSYSWKEANDSKLLLSFVSGIGYNFNLRKSIVKMEVRYVNGLSESRGKTDDYFSYNGLKILLGYGIKL